MPALPGFTRAERDPAWPLILAQVAGSRLEPQACDTVLAAGVAALAAAQALLFIDTGRPAAAVRNGTLELAVPDWQWRRRTWLPHPRCTCGAAGRPDLPRPGPEQPGTRPGPARRGHGPAPRSRGHGPARRSGVRRDLAGSSGSWHDGQLNM